MLNAPKRALALVLCAAPLACRAPIAPVQRLVLADVRQPATSLVFLGQVHGCFLAEGLDLQLHTFDLGRDALSMLLEGGADAAVAFDVTTLRRALADDRLRVLTALHTSTSNTRVVARRDRGVARTADLAGRRVAATPGTGARFFLETLLRFDGVDPGRVTTVELSPERAAEALAAGEVDAAVLADPVAERVQVELADAGIELRADVYTEASLLTTRAEVLADRRPALRALLRGLACAERSSRDRAVESVKAVRQRFPQYGAEEIDASLGRVRLGLGLDSLLLMELRQQSDWLRSTGQSSGAGPDLSRLIAPDLLDEVEPEAVNLLSLGGAR